MSMTTNNQTLIELAENALAGKWEFEAGEIWCTGDSGWVKHMANVEAGDDISDEEHVHNMRFITAASPAVVLALRGELEAAEELVELQRFKLERQAEDLHQAKSLESIHREKRFEVEQEFRDYKDRADSNSMMLAKEVCRLEDALLAAGISIAAATDKGE